MEAENSVSQNLVLIDNEVKVKRNVYSLECKQSSLNQLIVNESNGVTSAISFTSNEIGVAYHLLQGWSKNRVKILSSTCNVKNRRLNNGPELKYPDIEIHVKDWVISMRALSLCITCPMIVGEIFNKFPNRFTSFEKCIKWVYNVLDRLKLSIRAKTHDQGRLTEIEMGEIHVDFLEHFVRLQSFLNCPSSLIVNMDETGCYFNMSSKRTIEQRGTKQVNIKVPKNSSHCSVFLAVALDGSKLKPLVVFKGIPSARVSQELTDLDNRNAYICQINAFCDSEVMKYWIDNCLVPYNQEKQIGILMMDNFAAHNVASVRTKINEGGWAHLCLPPNMTSRVQLLDVSINKPFKDRMKRYHNQFMCENIRNNPKVTRRLMATWIADSWADIKAEFVLNGCRKIGFRVE